MPSTALIFDFGNVLAFFDYRRAASRIAEAAGRPAGSLEAALNDPRFIAVLKDYESGQIDDHAFHQKALAVFDVSIPFSTFETAWADIFWLNPPVAALARELKNAGLRLILGSNTNPIHARHYRRAFAEALDAFDRLVLSYEVGCIKPSRRFYQACVEAAGHPASNCLFIDDLPENVEGAIAAGLRGLRFVSEPALREDLRQLGVPGAADLGS